ncbi:RNase III domain-containing protein [Mycena sanguinolenta]|uniref:RNase III domain-containing protein n=1 Tax=Mycena sanguinolenta TaxID=230812 RepID=A0A8H6XXX1_9AGAR|nr:RNase III domain-containing protein [Mycena sanguinolenta]
MSRSLSARCLHRTVFSFPPPPSRPLPATRQYSYAALKKRPQSDRDHPRRRENPPPYTHVVPHEPGIRLQQEQSWGRSHELREQEPPRETETRRRVYEDEDGSREGGLRAEVGARDHDQQERGEGSSGHAGTTDRRHASRTPKSTRSGPSRPSPPQKPDQIFAEHLNGIFTPLKFPLELSARVLTHASHPAAFHGHNAQFSFIGRRVLESYLLLLLASSPHLKPSHDLQEIASRVLNTYFLGEHIGSKWGLGRVMRWTPTIAASMLSNESRADKAKLLKDVGLYKVQGDAVGAVMGAIFQQFGASVAHRVFHTRVLPRLLLPHGGLPTCFHQDAQEACERLGGVEGDLVSGSDVSARPSTLQEQKAKALPSPTLDRQTL